MPSFARSFLLLLSGFLITTSINAAHAQVPEIPVPGLHDMAIASWYYGPLPNGVIYNGPAIYFEPSVIASAGPNFVAFTKAHEYCHIYLNHLPKSAMAVSMNQLWVAPMLELEADTCATQTLLKNGQSAAVQAGAAFFYNQGPVPIDPKHPSGHQRFMNIKTVAALMGFGL